MRATPPGEGHTPYDKSFPRSPVLGKEQASRGGHSGGESSLLGGLYLQRSGGPITVKDKPLGGGIFYLETRPYTYTPPWKRLCLNWPPLGSTPGVGAGITLAPCWETVGTALEAASITPKESSPVSKLPQSWHGHTMPTGRHLYQERIRHQS